MEQIECINYDSIDATDARTRYYVLGFAYGSYAVYQEYPAFSDGDALDAFADWSRDNAPGFTPSPERIEELRADAVRDGRDDDELYIHDYYMRAGNDGQWIETPECIERLTLADLDRREWTIIPAKEREAV